MNTTNQKLMMAFLMTFFVVIGCSTLVYSQPVITVRFANPQYNCNTNIYCLDVEFQSNTANKELFGMNVRFFYDDLILEFSGFSSLVNNYSAVNPNPPTNIQSSLAFGQNYFGFQGAADFISGGIERTSSGTPVYISTTGWTKIFSICFTVNTPFPSEQSNCPPAVWDLEVDPANGSFFSGSEGVVITLVEGGGNSSPATENVDQFNWTYGSPGIYGHPIIESCTNVDCTLPVALLSFSGFQNETGNHLQWKTAAEINNYGFEVQRSQDGIKWDALGLVTASNNIQSVKQYNFSDHYPKRGMNLYRLKQLDLDGHFQYSSIVRLDVSGSKNLKDILVYPNPVSEGYITVTLPESDREISSVRLFSSTGQLVRDETKEGFVFQLDITNFQTGIYLLRIERGNEVLYKKVVIE